MNGPIPKWLLPAIVGVVVALGAVVGLLSDLGVEGPALIAAVVTAVAGWLLWHFAGDRRLTWAEIFSVVLLGATVFLGL